MGDEYISDGILSEVGASCVALREVPVAGKCGMFDSKREKVIW